MTDRRQPSEKSVERLWVQNAVYDIQHGHRVEERFRELFAEFQPACERYFQKRGFSPVDAEDLTQEAFLRVYKKIGTFRREASFETWLFGYVTASVASNEIRRLNTAKRRPEKTALATDPTGRQDEEDGMDDLTTVEDLRPGPFEQMMARIDAKQLDDAIGRLPPRMRQCFGFYRYGLSRKEIAAAMSVTEATVKQQLKIGTKRLQTLLAVTLYFLTVVFSGG